MSAPPPTLVVGAGVAGIVAASVLADRGERVVLLEAGPPAPRGADTAVVDGPDYLAALALPGRTWPGLVVRRTPDGPSVVYKAGRGVGGGAAINGGLVTGPVPPWLAVADVAPADWGEVDRAVVAAVERWPGTVVSPARFARRPDGRRALTTPDGRVEVRADALVDRVRFAGRRAVGVSLATGEDVEGSRVVLAAGALASPAILLRSGIDRPGVGANLRDHPVVVLDLRLRDGPAAGVPTTGCVVHVAPDLLLVPLNRTGPGQAGVMALCLHDAGAGRVRLASDDPRRYPEITFDLLAAEADRVALRAAVRALARVARHPAVTAVALGAGFGPRADPLALADSGDDAIDRWLTTGLGEVYHAAGTCRIGAADDPDAVVDERGAVIGTQGLYVVDASVLPVLPPAPPAATIAATAHRLATAMPAPHRWHN